MKNTLKEKSEELSSFFFQGLQHEDRLNDLEELKEAEMKSKGNLQCLLIMITISLMHLLDELHDQLEKLLFLYFSANVIFMFLKDEIGRASCRERV